MAADRDDYKAYQPLPLLTSPSQSADSAFAKELEALQAKIDEIEERENELVSLLEDMQRTFAARRAPIDEEIEDAAREKKQLKEKYAKMIGPPSIYPPAPGPRQLQFVDRGWFSVVCNAVVVINLACMAFAGQLQAYHSILYVLDQCFLLWYLFELGAKWTYHRRNLFFGPVSVVWWNWLDAGIVVGGIIDQWVMLIVKNALPFQVPKIGNMLRCLRLFRVLRFLKVLRALVHGDLRWTEEPPFQLFMSAVIGVNSIVLTLELDIDWAGWVAFEQAFLIIYSFELIVRMKEFGCRFFYNSDLLWNNLDFIMVCGGVFDLWFMPLWYMIQAALGAKTTKHDNAIANVLKILKIAKILRVLRLVRLLRVVKPLYRLLVGVMNALDAMKWVMALTIFLLYGGAIVFTSLIGHGYIYPSVAAVPPEAEEFFGSVPQSFFSLFKLMNGDTSVVEPITTDISGRLLFAAFMILSNWAILAILTSVVSDQMISSSAKIVEEDKIKDEQDRIKFRTRRLKHIFSAGDQNKNGSLSHAEWIAMLEDPHLCAELCSLSRLDKPTLLEVFDCLSEEILIKDGNGQADQSMAYLRDEDFISHLNCDCDGADRRQLLHHRYCLEKNTHARIQTLELAMHDRMEKMEQRHTEELRLARAEIRDGAEITRRVSEKLTS